jgi:hypothetical protein
LVHGRYYLGHHRKPGNDHYLHGNSHTIQRLFCYCHVGGDGKSIACCNGYAIARDDLRRSKQYDYSYWWRNLRLVHRRYYRIDQR